MNQFYPNSRRSLLSSFWQRKLFLFLFIFIGLLSTASAKTVIVGTGSGSVSVTSMGALVAGDTIAITAGTYSGGSFGSIHDVTIINYGGVVTFTGQIQWGNYAPYLYNVIFTGSGYPAATYGFVFSNINTYAFNCNLSGTGGQPFYGNRFLYMDFNNIKGTCFEFGYWRPNYVGTWQSLTVYKSSFAYCRATNCPSFLNVNTSITGSTLNVADSIDVHDNIINQYTNNGPQINGTIFDCNIYNNKVTYSGYITVTGDVGFCQIQGRGAIHHNYIHGGRGYIARFITMNFVPGSQTFAPATSDSWVYDNIKLATTTYGGIDTRGSTDDYGTSNAYLTYGNLHFVNNTLGNMSYDDGYSTDMAVCYKNFGTVYVNNNLAFNTAVVGNDDHISDDFSSGSGGTAPIRSNNLYFTGAQVLGPVLLDTVNCFISPGSPLIDAGATVSFVTTDFSGIPRPQGAGYDIGAREYSTSSTFVVANAGSNNTITLPSNSVTLNGKASYAINSTLTSYVWGQISGPNTAVLSSPDSAITQATSLIIGTYIFSLKVKDANNDSSSATVSITVNAANQPPVVNAGTNQTIILPTSTVTLAGSATDATGTIVSHVWSQVSGPNTAGIASASSYSTNVSSLIAGTYIFQLKATDNNSLSGTSTVTIIVNPAPNQAPVVNAGTSQIITLPSNTATLSGNATDATGTIVSYTWTQKSGPNTATIGSPNAITTGISGLVVGVYVFQLSATDNNNLSGSATVTIHVNPAAVQPPVANAGLNQTITLPTNSVSLNGTASYDPVGSIVSYSWSEISGPSTVSITGSNSATSSVSALVQGVYIFELTVLNNGGASSSAQVTVTVNNITIANPIANAGPDQSITLPDNSVSLNGSQSYVPDGGTIASYNWVQISGAGGITIANSTTATPQVTGLQVGQYVFELTVTNSIGVSASAQVTITVLQGHLPPVANAGSDTTIALPTTSITLDGSSSYAPSGSITTYLWSQLQGPNTAVFASMNTSITSVYGLQPGVYKFQLMVTDNNGISATSTISDTVIDNLRTSSSASLLLYPNPTSSSLNLQISNDTSGTVIVYIYDMLGNIIKANQFTKQSSFFSTPIDVSLLKSGTYTLQAVLANKGALVAKFVKQ